MKPISVYVEQIPEHFNNHNLSITISCKLSEKARVDAIIDCIYEHFDADIKKRLVIVEEANEHIYSAHQPKNSGADVMRQTRC